MKTYNDITKWVPLLFICLGFAACGKDDIGKKQVGDSSLSMKINGEHWGTTINTLFTEAHESSELGEYFLVLVGGQRIGVDDSEDDVSAFNMYIAIPRSKFNNPKGSYSIMKESEAKVGQATAHFTVNTGSGQTWYASYHPASPTQAGGTVEITGFEIGEQRVLGQPTGVEGYTKLSGTFRMDLYAVQENPGAPLKVTEGKFNLKSGMGFDF